MRKTFWILKFCTSGKSGDRISLEKKNGNGIKVLDMY